MVNNLYDQLGFLRPVTIRGKVLLRDLIGSTRDWDEPISEDSREQWDDWVQNLHSLDLLKIPRRYHQFSAQKIVTQELHVYADASETAIAAVAYLKTIHTFHNMHMGFVMGKSKVASKQGHTIPQLELCACVLAVEIA